jgi:hypothetical protein
MLDGYHTPTEAPQTPAAHPGQLATCDAGRLCIQIGKHLDIACIDHLIIGAGRWVSVGAWLKQREVESGERAAA